MLDLPESAGRVLENSIGKFDIIAIYQGFENHGVYTILCKDSEELKDVMPRVLSHLSEEQTNYGDFKIHSQYTGNEDYCYTIEISSDLLATHAIENALKELSGKHKIKVIRVIHSTPEEEIEEEILSPDF